MGSTDFVTSMYLQYPPSTQIIRLTSMRNHGFKCTDVETITRLLVSTHYIYLSLTLLKLGYRKFPSPSIAVYPLEIAHLTASSLSAVEEEI